MEAHNQVDINSRADVICRVFRMKVKAFIKFLKEEQTFGEVSACKTFTFLCEIYSILLLANVPLLNLCFSN